MQSGKFVDRRASSLGRLRDRSPVATDYLSSHSDASRQQPHAAQCFHINSGDNIQDLMFRLEPWGAIEGKIRFEDGEAASGVA